MKANVHKLLILGLFSILCSAVFAEDKIHLTNGEWAPFQSAKLPGYGAASRAMTAAFSAVDIEVEYGFFPWNRAMELVRQGLWDGTFMWVLTPERSRDFLVSDALFTVQEVVYYSLDRPLAATHAKDMKGKTMGALHASAFGAQFNEFIESGEITVIRAHTNQQLFQMLSNGRVDFVPELETSGSDAIREFLTTSQQEKIATINSIKHPWSYHLLISRLSENGAHFLSAFNKGLVMIKADGTFESIMGRYIRPEANN
ncbi:MAG: polar amino acid transport system substrate-binding protein [Gammaproteobacteria bacterium]|jgi:polar amino acid transport system substrate-binding protein